MRQRESRAHQATPPTPLHLHAGLSAPAEAELWITRAEAAEILGITPGGIGYFVQRGDLHPRPRSRHRPTLRRAEVQRLADARSEQAARRESKIPPQPRHPQDGRDWLSALQVARLLGRCRVWVDLHALRGDIPYTVGPQGRRSYRADLIELYVSDSARPAQAARQSQA
jgi:hypothetical protein